MSEARVESVDAIKAFRRAWLKFAEAANVALTEAEADAVGTARWLESEQRTYWQNNLRKTTELVSKCEEAVRHKKIFKDSSGRTPSAVDEEKALAKARRMKEIAEEKVEAVRRYTPRLKREIMLYKGQVQRLATFLAADIPTAAAKLDKITQTLEAYLGLQAEGAAAAGGMAQPTGSAEATPGEENPPNESIPPAETKPPTEPS